VGHAVNTLIASPSDPVLAGRTWPDDFPPAVVATVGLPHRPESAGAARRFMKSVCDSAGIPEQVCESLVLCVSELVGNAVRALFPAGRGWFFVQVLRQWPFTIVRVHDPALSLPNPHVVNVAEVLDDEDLDGEIGGWGLSSIVGSLADHLAFGVGPRLKFVEIWIASPFGVR
jgi:anti-sigma regulatory factor (Ser/Thr protein kinase)